MLNLYFHSDDDSLLIVLIKYWFKCIKTSKPEYNRLDLSKGKFGKSGWSENRSQCQSKSVLLILGPFLHTVCFQGFTQESRWTVGKQGYQLEGSSKIPDLCKLNYLVLAGPAGYLMSSAHRTLTAATTTTMWRLFSRRSPPLSGEWSANQFITHVTVWRGSWSHRSRSTRMSHKATNTTKAPGTSSLFHLCFFPEVRDLVCRSSNFEIGLPVLSSLIYRLWFGLLHKSSELGYHC